MRALGNPNSPGTYYVGVLEPLGRYIVGTWEVTVGSEGVYFEQLALITMIRNLEDGSASARKLTPQTVAAQGP